MIDTLKTLTNKTTLLEEKIENLSENTQKSTETNNYICFNKNLINYSILTKQRILVAKIEVTQGANLYFQMMVELNLSSAQKVTFSIIANEISIYKSTKSLSIGFNQITLLKSFTPLTSEQVDIYLEIYPNDQKEILLDNISLSVWGLTGQNEGIKYQILETENTFLLSLLSSERIYLLETPKEISTNNSEDFSIYKSAKSYSFVYNNISKVLYLFRVDLSGNLLYSNFSDKNEILITSNISSVSAVSNGNLILVTYIKNNSCYFIELKDGVFSCEKQIICPNKFLTSVYCYYNDFSNKFYIIMSGKDGSNYFVESSNEGFSSGENIKSTANILVSTYTVEESV